MYWQYTTAFAVSVAAAMNPVVRKANDATAILIFIIFSLAKFFDAFSNSYTPLSIGPVGPRT